MAKKKGNKLVIKTSKKSSFRIPEGVYKARLTNVETTNGQYGEQLVWDFKIIAGKKKGSTLKMWSPIEATPKNKTGKTIKAIGNKKKIGDGSFDLGKLIKRKCKLLVEDHKTQAGDKTSKIGSVLPFDLDDDVFM